MLWRQAHYPTFAFHHSISYSSRVLWKSKLAKLSEEQQVTLLREQMQKLLQKGVTLRAQDKFELWEYSIGRDKAHTWKHPQKVQTYSPHYSVDFPITLTLYHYVADKDKSEPARLTRQRILSKRSSSILGTATFQASEELEDLWKEKIPSWSFPESSPSKKRKNKKKQQQLAQKNIPYHPFGIVTLEKDKDGLNEMETEQESEDDKILMDEGYMLLTNIFPRIIAYCEGHHLPYTF